MKADFLDIALLQLDLKWHNAKANRNACESYFKTLPITCKLVVLPEMFTSGFTMKPDEVAESMDGTTVSWLKKWAFQLDTAICASMVIVEGANFYNRFLFVKPDGTIDFYDKRHTFNMAGEGEVYTAGERPILIEYLGWKLFPQICYDLRFPVFSRNREAYDLLLYVANWPETRITAWDALLKARAIENMSYCIGVNRVGVDGNELKYIGHSNAYDLLGTPLLKELKVEGIRMVTLEAAHISDTRKKLPFLNDRDQFTLH